MEPIELFFTDVRSSITEKSSYQGIQCESSDQMVRETVSHEAACAALDLTEYTNRQ